MAHGKFCTAINCMDGRTQFPVANWMKEQFHLDYVDMITEPGPDKILASAQGKLVESIKSRVQISIKAHGSKIVAIIAHNDCAGNPVDKEQHLLHVKKSIQTVRSWNLSVEKIVGLWVNEDWKVEIIEPSSQLPQD
jgi:hypothetical protein